MMIVSTAYRQASRHEPEQATGASALAESIDPGNTLLWRMRLRRIESETIRDAILATSGDLDQTCGGPPVLIKARADGMVTVAQGDPAHPGQAFRRSIYLTARRAYNVSLLTVFDQPLVATNCVQRKTGALALQSLFMINDAFLAEQADHFATRVEGSARAHGVDTVEHAFRLALARKPAPSEIAICRDLLRNQAERFQSRGGSPEAGAHRALTQLCLILFNTSEFLFAE
jgi:hypothetical protein